MIIDPKKIAAAKERRAKEKAEKEKEKEISETKSECTTDMTAAEKRRDSKLRHRRSNMQICTDDSSEDKSSGCSESIF